MRRRKSPIYTILVNRKKLIHFIIAPLAMVALVVVYLFGVRSSVSRSVILHVPRGASVSSVAAQVHSSHLVESMGLFKLSVRIQGGQVQSGQYEISRGTSTWRIAQILTSGRVATTKVVIPEGLTVKQIKKLLLSMPELTGDVECDTPSDAPLCNLRDGDLFPDTYRVARGESRLNVLELMRKKMSSIQNNWLGKGIIKPSPLKNWNEIVILASIVQKETPREIEMPIVASVYLNRLRKNMRLQADPTVVYALTDGLGDMQGEPLLRGHLKIDSPYNTYTNNGLPPAPIANVGQAAIRAVLKPADTSYLFFVADGHGGHKFSRTYEEHMQHHANWRQIKKNRGINQ